MNAPSFSVIIPAFGRPEALARALASCRAQSFGDFEVIVVDDSSPEPLAPVVERFGDSRVQLVRNVRNLGASGARNVGMRLAGGRYVVFLDADDVMLPTRLARLAARLQEDPDLVLHRQYRVFDASPKAFAYDLLPRVGLGTETDLAAFAFRDGNFYNMNSFAVRRDLLADLTFRPGLRLYEDQAFIFDCHARARHTIVLDDALAVYVDDARQERASRRYRDAADLTAFLDYARSALSSRAICLIEAAVRSERGDALTVLAPAVLRACRQGLPPRRAAFYLLRRVIGREAAARLRDRTRQPAGSQSMPEWASLLRS